MGQICTERLLHKGLILQESEENNKLNKRRNKSNQPRVRGISANKNDEKSIIVNKKILTNSLINIFFYGKKTSDSNK